MKNQTDEDKHEVMEKMIFETPCKTVCQLKCPVCGKTQKMTGW